MVGRKEGLGGAVAGGTDAGSAQRTQPLRVLLVDDEPLVLRVLRRGLERAGYQVEQASGGTEALALLTKGTVSVLVSDYQMPEMNGLELARQVRQRYPALPVVLVSGSSPDEKTLQQLLRVADSFVPKSSPPRTLAEEVQRVLSRRK